MSTSILTQPLNTKRGTKIGTPSLLIFASVLIIFAATITTEIIDIQIPQSSNAVISGDILPHTLNSNLTKSNLLPTIFVTLKDPNEINATLSEQIQPIVETLIKNDLTLTSLNYSKELNVASINVTDNGLSPVNVTEEGCIGCIPRTETSSSLDFLLPSTVYDLSTPKPTIQIKISDALQEINNTGVGTAELDQVFAAQYEQAQTDSHSSQLIKKASQSQIIPFGFSRIDGDLAIRKLKLNNSKFIDADIAIVDSGINPHPDLNIFNHTSFVSNSTSDTCGHGTHVAGIAAAKDNNFGVIGTAPGARLWDVKVLNDECKTTKDSLLRGLKYVLAHKDKIEVVNLSLGGYCDPSSPLLCNSNKLDKLIAAISRNMVVVVAAGNGVPDFLSHRNKPDNSVNWKPAKFNDIITVSNFVDSDGKCGGLGNTTYRGKDDFLANTSNFGEPVDIAAPGVDVLSTSNDGSYVFYSGTSMSAPLVAGTAALYKSLNPSATPAEIIADLSFSSVDKGTACKGAHGYVMGGDQDNYPEPVLDLMNLIP